MRGGILAGIVVVGAVAASGAVLAAWQKPPAAPVFTADQAAVGRASYVKNCASCHMADLSGNVEYPPLAGAAFLNTWRTRSTKDLFDYMSAAMPYGAPSLTVESYAAITAYILQSNGAAAGSDPLSGSTVLPIGSVTAPPEGRAP